MKYNWRNTRPKRGNENWGVKSRVVVAAKSRAKQKKLPFSISVESLEWPEFCPVLGIKLNYEWASGKRDDNPSLDQLIPGRGYALENVRVISWRANRIKSNGTAVEHLAIANYIRLQIPQE